MFESIQSTNDFDLYYVHKYVVIPGPYLGFFFKGELRYF